MKKKTTKKEMSKKPTKKERKFHIEFNNPSQRLAWAMFQKQDVTFLSGVAGTAKTYLASAFAIHECLQNRKKIIICRPIVEAGESLGYLPGDFQEKVDPYMRPIYDSINKLIGSGAQMEKVEGNIEVAPIAFLRGRTLDDSVCILDEAQNATTKQLILFLSRLGKNSKMIITGDPTQSDIGEESGFMKIVNALDSLSGIGIMKFSKVDIVRHPLVNSILEKLEGI
jgi:phosphate starvation-inducible PhoH-like protein